MEALFDLPSDESSYRYNPRRVIRAVNLLQPLGKEKALAAIDEFLRVSFDLTDGQVREGILLVLRTLFEVPSVPTIFPSGLPSKPGYMPPIDSSGLGPSDEHLIPRFPISVENGIPFLLVESYDFEGRRERPESHVAYFRKYGKVRAKPLTPTVRPFEALQAFEKSARWYFKTQKEDPVETDQRERILLGNQVLNLLDTVFRVEPNSTGMRICFNAEEQNNRVIAEASKLAIRWDSKASQYTFLDRKSLSEFDPNRYPELSWKPTVAGLPIELTIKRKSRHYVGVGLGEEYVIGKPRPRAVVRVFSVKTKDKALCEFQVGGTSDLVVPGIKPELAAGTTAGGITGTTIRLEEGDEIQAELTVNGKESQRSPVFKP